MLWHSWRSRHSQRSGELLNLRSQTEPKWHHDMSGEHTGQGGPDASGEHLHLPGGPWDPERGWFIK